MTDMASGIVLGVLFVTILGGVAVLLGILLVRSEERRLRKEAKRG